MTAPQWLEDILERQKPNPDVRIGSRVRMSAQFTSLSEGIVEALDGTGFKVNGLWFGWKELVEVMP